VKTRAIQGLFLAVVLAGGAGSAIAGIFDKTSAGQGISAFKSGNYDYARTWLSTQAAAEDPQAWYYLGRMYQEGLGGFAVDLKRAEKLYHQSAEQGVTESMLALADLYSRGGGVKPNVAVAQVWHEKAARAGNVEGMFLTAQDLTGKNGRPAGYNRARIWFEQAASAGHSEAMRALGDLYRNGQGVDVSMVQALMWYRLAVKSGNTEAKTGEVLLSKILPPAQQAEADGLAREWEVLTGRAPAAPVQTAVDSKKTSDSRNDSKTALPLATSVSQQ